LRGENAEEKVKRIFSNAIGSRAKKMGYGGTENMTNFENSRPLLADKSRF